jgi:MFS family permease
VAGILFAVTKVKSWGWWDGRTLSWLGGGIIVLVLWVVYELKHKNPLINVRLFMQRQVALTTLAMALFAFGTSQVMQVLLLLLQQPEWTLVGFGVSATVAALLKFPSLALSMVASPWSGSIAGTHGARRAMLIGAVLVALGWVGMTANHSTIPLLVTMLFLISFGGAMVYAAMPNLLVEAVPAERTSEAIGLLHVIRTTFTAVGAQVVAFALATSTVSDPARGLGSYPSASAYFVTFAGITVSSLLVVLVTFALPRRRIDEPVSVSAANAITG